MKIVYAGDTAKFPIEIQRDGVVVSPTNVALLKWSQIIVYSRTNADNVVGRYAYGGVLQEGWSPLVVDGDSNKLYLILSKADTAKVIDEELIMQITNCFADPIMPDGEDEGTGTAVICKVKKRVI